MFEKSLYDLIRGLRNHKGQEKEYIQNSIKECRAEIKGQDMDLKATALLKLVYLEMFGHDMSWSSFHALEVMSSAHYLQKRVGYLAAVQSFRPNTDVLMLATNLLKKDVTSASTQIMSLPLGTLPHLVNSQLAMSLLNDLVPRLSHSKASIRKKTVLTLYRLALVYPETLRIAWPKIKERLMDDKEDSSVTCAVINVTCELGWRRPRDFLPLAPRLFELLVDGDNNWMAIKIIKLFATLTPLEPRLVRKLLPPLTSIIKTTPAMSLLYECINGIIQGGILDGANKINEGDEIASLCVDKLRGMIATENDPNLRYVALLAFKKIVSSYTHLADLHQDIILSCIDDADISIRLRALDLMTGMVSGENLEFIVNTLLKQLQVSRDDNLLGQPESGRLAVAPIEPAADSDQEDPEESLQSAHDKSSQVIQLPDDYKVSIVKTILSVCSADTYAFVLDFSWYIGILVQLTRLVPYIQRSSHVDVQASVEEDSSDPNDNLSTAVGAELRNIAVRVQGIRLEAVRAAEMLITTDQQTQSSADTSPMTSGFLGPVVWIVGEYNEFLNKPEQVLEALLAASNVHLDHQTLSLYLQATMKVYCRIINHDTAWDKELRAMASLRTARVLHFLDLLTSHPNLEVQERAVGFAEYLRIMSEAIADCKFDLDDEATAPLLLTSVLPSFFSGAELKPVAPDAQRKIPLPSTFNFDKPINPQLSELLQAADHESHGDVMGDNDFEDYYHKKPEIRLGAPAADTLQSNSLSSSYQKDSSFDSSDPLSGSKPLSRKPARDRDDPFYIQHGSSLSGTSTPIHDILKDSNGEALDVDSIPIMPLDLEGDQIQAAETQAREMKRARLLSKRANISIVKDEDIDAASENEPALPRQSSAVMRDSKLAQSRKGLLGVDSSALSSLNMDPSASHETVGPEEPYEEDAEMAKALKEVERLRLEMQRASERIEAAQGVPREGTLIKKKKRKKVIATAGTDEGVSALEASSKAENSAPAEVVKKKKKRKKPKEAATVGSTGSTEDINADA